MSNEGEDKENVEKVRARHCLSRSFIKASCLRRAIEADLRPMRSVCARSIDAAAQRVNTARWNADVALASSSSSRRLVSV